MNPKKEAEWKEQILHKLYDLPGREVILLPTMFSPPILLSNIQRLGGELAKEGLTTPPHRRLGGWHMRLLDAGVTHCLTPAVPVHH